METLSPDNLFEIITYLNKKDLDSMSKVSIFYEQYIKNNEDVFYKLLYFRLLNGEEDFLPKEDSFKSKTSKII
jgi:hypothetical protein